MWRFNDFPKEIVFEILTRLPTESVLECKLVCKPWRDVVHHTSFSQLHLTRLDSAEDSGKLSFIFRSFEQGINTYYYAEYYENRHETRETRINLCPFFKKVSFVGSCNGLICFDAFLEGNEANNYIYHYGPAYICNPITGEFVILQKFERKYWWTGFGYSPSANQYKIVRIYESGGDSNVGIVQVYTLGSGAGWRNADKMDIDMECVKKCPGVFVNGTLHWVNYQGTIILAFSLADENFIELPTLPPCLSGAGAPYPRINLGVLGGFLSATFYYNRGGCDIWLLKKKEDNVGSSWSKEFSFDSHILQPFEIMKSGRLLCYGYNKIYIYNPKALSAKMGGKFIIKAIPHKNTVVSLKVLGEKDTKTIKSSERASSSEEI